jgi:hypothetical protein
MAEIMARVAAAGRIELVDDTSAAIESVEPLTPSDAAYLARGMLACAVALSCPNPPQTGTIVGDAHMPIMKWAVAASSATGEPLLILSVPSGIELVFVVPRQGAIAMGGALISVGEGTAPLEGHSETIH